MGVGVPGTHARAREAVSGMDWSRLPARTLKEILVTVHPGEDADAWTGRLAAAALQEDFPEPDLAFMERGSGRRSVAHIVRDSLQSLGGLSITYSRAESAGLVRSRSGRPPSEATKLRRLRECRLDKTLRGLLLTALLEAGRSTRPAESGRQIQPVMHIPTRDQPIGKPLYPHQRRVVRDLEARWEAERNRMRGLVVMPTGSGKTRTTVDWLLAGPVSGGCKVLWLTHSVYLLEQTAGVFQDQAPIARLDKGELVVRLIGGGNSLATTIASPIHDVVIATVQSFQRKPVRDHVRSWLHANDVVVVFDEAHHAVAPSWRAPLDMAVNETNDAIIGLTATPTRLSDAGTADLAALFGATGSTMDGAIISEVGADELVEQGVLARPIFHTVDTEFDLDARLTDRDRTDIAAFGDFSKRILDQLVNETPRNQAIVDAYLRGPQGDGSSTFGQAIVYAVNIPHAEILQRLFGKKGVAAEAIFHTRGSEANAASLERFKQKKTQVLVNVEMLTEGIDVPAAEAVLLARPTLSFSLFSQMVGRALRGPKVGGTAYAHIVDFRDLLGQFEKWRVDFSRLQIVDGAPEVEAPPSERAPQQTYELEPLIALGLELSERLALPPGGAFRRVPVGYYLFAVDATSPEGEPRTRTLLVFDHDRDGYDEIARRVEAGDLSNLKRRSWSGFFADLRGPVPNESDLEDLRAFVLAERAMPPFVELAVVDELNPTAVAQGIVDAGGTAFDALESGTREAYERHPLVIDRVWGGQGQFERDVRDEWARILKGLPIPKEERRIRSLTFAEAEEWAFGDGGIDLVAIQDELLADRSLFPDGLRRPRSRISWSSGAIRNWAQYDPLSEYIEVTKVLNSSQLASLPGGLEALKYLVFHELLHHEQEVLNLLPEGATNAMAHDDAFYRREHSYPDFALHDAFLDDFMRQFAARP